MTNLNINPKTGVAYGYISANTLDPGVVEMLLDGGQACNYTMERVQQEITDEVHAEAAERGFDHGSPDWEDFVEREIDRRLDDAGNACSFDEPHIEGVYEGVSYATPYLGGALNFWIFESPFTTDRARRASPCVPGAAILDELDGHESGYDVPGEWRAEP